MHDCPLTTVDNHVILFVQGDAIGVECRSSTKLTSLRFLLNNRPTVWFRLLNFRTNYRHVIIHSAYGFNRKTGQTCQSHAGPINTKTGLRGLVQMVQLVPHVSIGS
jgi:hypothetical protein